MADAIRPNHNRGASNARNTTANSTVESALLLAEEHVTMIYRAIEFIDLDLA